MAITEESRYQLYQSLQQALGEEQATTLMEHLPPVGWADVATKRDLDVLANATRRDLDVLANATKRDLDVLANELRAEMHRGFNKIVIANFASMISFAGVLVAAAHLA